jgi:hypothetical protein
MAFLGQVKRDSSDAAVGGRREPDVARQLLQWLTSPSASSPSGSPGRSLGSHATGGDSAGRELSLLRRWQSQHDDMLRVKGRLLTLPNDAAGRAEALAIAANFLPVGAPAPWLQAALGLAGEDGVAMQNPSIASRCAYAMDPTFFASPAQVFASLPRPNQARGDLEDLFVLETGERLVRLCSGASPQAVALRARFASRCARSLVAQLAKAPLEVDAALALRDLADPFVLREIAAVVVPAGRWRELLTYWRADLPLPEALLDVAKADVLADQLQLAAALRGRRDASCYPVVAEFLVAEPLELRRMAGEALRLLAGDRIDFDAHWPRSRRQDAATRLLDLHNRKP